MLQKDVVIGGVYRVRWHDGSFTEVEILGTTRPWTPATMRGQRRVGYSARNLATGRIVTIKSAAKLRDRVR